MEERVMYCRKCEKVYIKEFNTCVLCGGKLVKAIKTNEKNFNLLRIIKEK